MFQIFNNSRDALNTDNFMMMGIIKVFGPIIFRRPTYDLCLFTSNIWSLLRPVILTCNV